MENTFMLTKCSDEDIARQLIEYSNSKKEKVIYLYCVDVLVNLTRDAEYAIYIIDVLRKKGIHLCFMEDGLRTDIMEQEEELKSRLKSYSRY